MTMAPDLTQCMRDLVAQLKRLRPDQRERFMRELRGLCDGYEAGKNEVWQDLLNVDDGSATRRDQALDVLAASMNEANIISHSRSAASRKVVPKGWA